MTANWMMADICLSLNFKVKNGAIIGRSFKRSSSLPSSSSWEGWSGKIGIKSKRRPSLSVFFYLILSTLIFAFSYFIQIWAWYLITLRLGIAIPLKETVGSWFYSQLGKYLPGKVWLLLGRLYFYDSKGKSRKAITVALYFETVTMIMAAGLVFLVSLLFLKEVKPFYSGIPLSG